MIIRAKFLPRRLNTPLARVKDMALSRKGLLIIAVVLLSIQPLLNLNNLFVQAAPNPSLSLTGSIWENEDGSSPDTVTQLAAGDGTIEAPWGSRINLRAQLRNSGDALSGTSLGLFYDKGDGLWTQAANSNPKINAGSLPTNTVIDNTGDMGQRLDVAMDNNNKMWISYYDNGSKNLRVAEHVGSGGSGCSSSEWTCTTVDSTDIVGLNTSIAIDGNNNPWVTYFDDTNDNLEVARYVGSGGTGCDTAAWECSSIDTSGSVGNYPFLAFDAAGKAWVSYQDFTSNTINIAHYVGSGGTGCAITAWTCTSLDNIGTSAAIAYSSLAFDDEGKAWVSYTHATNADLMIAEYVGSGGSNCDTAAWTCTIVDNSAFTGGDNYIAIDQDGTPWVSYTISSDLGVAKYVGSGGDCTSSAWECTTVETANTVGIFTSIAFDDNNNPWVAHRDTTNNNLRVAKYVGTGGTGCAVTDWSCTAVDVSGYDTGSYGRIIFGQYNEALIAYHDTSNTSLELMQLTDWPTGSGCANDAFASMWQCSNVVTSGGVGRQSSMALDNSGVPWIAYVDSTNSDLEIAKYVGKGGSGCAVDSWDCSVVESTSDVGYHPSLTFDEGNNPWVSHRNDTTKDLRVAHYVGSGGSCNNTAWQCEGVDTTGNIDSFTSIAVDSSGNAWVSYRDATAGTLKVANYVGGGSGSGCDDNDWTCTTVEGANDNGDGSFIAFDAAGDAWVSFYSNGVSPGQQLQVAKYVGSGGSGCNSSAWTCSVIYDDNLVNNTSIAFDPAGDAWIAFKVVTGDLIVAKYVGSGGSNCGSGVTDWNCTVVENVNDSGQGASIAFDPAGNAWISYQDETDLTVKVARYVGSGGSGCASSAWTCSVVQSGVPTNNMSSTLVFDNNGTAWLSYYDNTAVDLKLAKLERAGEILLSPAQRYANGTAISESHADMTSTTDTTNRDDADCIGGGTWNNGMYFSSSTGAGISLPDGSSTAQCTEVVFTIDLSQAEVGATYRFKIASSDSWNQNRSAWRGLTGGGVSSELTVTDVSMIAGKDNSIRLPDCDTDTDWGCAELDASGSGTDDLRYPKIAIDSEGNPWATWEDEVNDFVVVANYVGSGGTGCSTAAWNCENVADAGLYGGFSAIAAGEDGSIWVSYYDNADTALAVAKYVGSGGSCNDANWGNANITNGSDAWDCETVDDSSTVGRNVGERTDIAIDSYGNPWISYYDTSARDLKVARYVGSGGNCDDGTLTGSDAWHCETVDETGQSGRYSSIAISGENDVWIMQHDHPDFGNDQLRIAHYVGTGGNCTSDAWDCKVLEDAAGQYGGIAIDHDGNPWVSYRTSVSGDLKVANYVGTGGSGCYTGVTDWTCVKVDTTAVTGQQSSIAIAPDGNPWVAYLYSNTGQLRLSRYVGSGGSCDDIYGGDSSDAWDCTTIEDAGSVGVMPYIAFDFSGNAWIVSNDSGNKTIRIAKTHRPIVPLSTESNLRVKARSAGNGFARYLLSPGKTNTSNPGSCDATSDYFGACSLFNANGDYDTITAQANEAPYWTFAQRYDSNAELPTAQWEGLSTLAPNTAGTAGDLALQVYRYGTTNAWETIATDTTSSSCSSTNCRLEGVPAGTTSEYFELKNGKYWVHFRLYQEPSTSSSITFKTDQFKAATNEQRARHGGFMQDGYKRPLNWR